MNVKQLAFRKACATLSAIGAHYAAVFEDIEQTSPNLEYAMKVGDKVHGVLAYTEPKPARAPRRSFLYTGYSAALATMGIGDTWEYQCEDSAEAKHLQAAVAGTACKLWGRGSYITTVKVGHVLEVLRVS